MTNFTKSVLINTEINKLFDFHTNPENLNKISPPFLKVKIKSISDIPLVKDSLIVLEVGNFGFVTEWKVQIKECQKPTLVKDLQLKGLFGFWEHSHIFEVAGDKVKMTDSIDFTPPFGFLGYFLCPFIFLGLNVMFSIRHKKTKELFEMKG